jgi:hypothetical protein
MKPPSIKETPEMNLFFRIVGFVIAIPIIIGLLAIELGKMAFYAALYAFEVVYDGIRYRDWYL